MKDVCRLDDEEALATLVGPPERCSAQALKNGLTSETVVTKAARVRGWRVWAAARKIRRNFSQHQQPDACRSVGMSTATGGASRS
jgi:hypothetical protein